MCAYTAVGITIHTYRKLERALSSLMGEQSTVECQQGSGPHSPPSPSPKGWTRAEREVQGTDPHMFV